MKYKGFKGSVEYSKKDKVYFGKILKIKDLVLYEGINLIKLKKDFKDAVNEYIELKLELESKLVEKELMKVLKEFEKIDDIKEDLGLSILMQQANRKDTVSRNEIMETLDETNYLLSNKNNRKRLLKSIQEVKDGKTTIIDLDKL